MAALMRSCIAAQVYSCYSLHSDTFHSRRSRIVKLLHRPTPVLVRTYICLSFDLVGSNHQTTHLWSIKGTFLQQSTRIFWNTVALMARKPIRLCAKWCNRLTVKVCFFSRLSELAEQLRVTVFVAIPQINLFNKILLPNGFGNEVQTQWIMSQIATNCLLTRTISLREESKWHAECSTTLAGKIRSVEGCVHHD